MKKLTVVQFLETFSEKEFKRFDQYIHSPFFTKHKGVIALFDYIKAFYPLFPAEKIRKEEVFADLFPDEKYIEKRIYKLGSRLYQELLNFLALQELMKDQTLWESILPIPSLYFRNIDSFLPSLLVEAKQKMEKQPLRDDTYYLYQFHLQKAQNNIVLSQDSRDSGLKPKSIFEDFNQYILIVKLRLLVALLNRNYMFKGEELDAELKEVKELYERMEPKNSKVAGLYWQLVHMFLEPQSEEAYKKYRDLISRYGSLMRKEAEYEAYIYGANFCSSQIKQGKSEYLEEVFRIYAELLDKELFFLFPSVSHVNFKNVNNVSLHLNKLEWAKDFNKEYGKFLPKKYRDTVVNYCQARISFEEKEYKLSLKKLQTLEFFDPFYRLNYDLLVIKNFYETEAYSAMISRCDASLKFLRRETAFSENNKASYLNTIKFIKRLGNAIYKKKKNLAWIQRDFSNTALMVDRKWMKEKIAELKENNQDFQF